MTEEKLFELYCKYIMDYVKDRKYVVLSTYESDFGSFYCNIGKYEGSKYATKVRVSTHAQKGTNNIDVQFRVDLNSIKRPPKHLKEKVYRSLDNAMSKASACYIRHLLSEI